MTPALKLAILAVLAMIASDSKASIFDQEITGDPTPEPVADHEAQNVAAFLMTIRYAEGTAGPDGYRMLFGGSLFDSYDGHPQIVIKAGKYRSSAAGAYQILKDTWFNVIQPALHLPDFSPASQDAGAIYLIRQKDAYDDVVSGRFAVAIEKVRKVWASLPGAGYNQPERSLDYLAEKFTSHGGVIV